jgi:glycosyltransferase involved in cell wall biosynthesis
MKIGILITTYNDSPSILNRGLYTLYSQSYKDLNIVCVDDGSTIPAKEKIDFQYSEERLKIVTLLHGERFIARQVGLKMISQLNCDYFLFLDSDMSLPSADFIEKLVDFTQRKQIGAVVIPEKAYSNSTNFWTRVKVFERNLYEIGGGIDFTSIEAARFWKWAEFPGFTAGLNAFEEIQPTLRFIEGGGQVAKFDLSLDHDEKHVTLRGVLIKKSYYFSQMGNHEAVKLKELFKKFYFFRRQLYLKKNLIKYIRSPFLCLGVITMYLMLTFNGAYRVLKKQKTDQ